jgi:hypothetical protein
VHSLVDSEHVADAAARPTSSVLLFQFAPGDIETGVIGDVIIFTLNLQRSRFAAEKFCSVHGLILGMPQDEMVSLLDLLPGIFYIKKSN